MERLLASVAIARTSNLPSWSRLPISSRELQSLNPFDGGISGTGSGQVTQKVELADGGDPYGIGPELNEGLLRAFLGTFMPASALIYRGPFCEVHGLSPHIPGVPKQYVGDPRWAMLYGHPLFVAAAHWIGARAVLESREDPQDPLPPREQLREIADRAEAHFSKLLNSALGQFWDGNSTEEDSSHSMEELVLVYVLALGTMYADRLMGRTAAAVTFFKLLRAVFEVIGVPGEANLPVDRSHLDDFLLSELWATSFWLPSSLDHSMSFSTRRAPLQDLVKEHPTVPLPIPQMLLLKVPPPSAREINGPTPAFLLEKQLDPFTARDILSWMDPARNLMVCSPPTKLFSRCFGQIVEYGSGYLFMVLDYLGSRIALYMAYLKEVAGVSALDVLVAEQIIEHEMEAEANGADATAIRAAIAREYDLDELFLNNLLGNPHIPEAVRRRRYLRQVNKVIQASLPDELMAACRKGDYDSLLATCGMMIFPFLPLLIQLRQYDIIISSPEPFANLMATIVQHSNAAPEQQSHTDMNEHDDTIPEPLQRIWFHSLAFSDASESSLILCRNLRQMLKRWGHKNISTSIMALGLGIAATYAAWFNFLVLDRFRWMIGELSERDQAAAIVLHEEIVQDVRSCLEMLAATARPRFEQIRTVFQGLLDGGRTQLSPGEVQMLRMAHRTVSRCPHRLSGGDSDGIDGACWICATRDLRLEQSPTSLDLVGHVEGPLGKVRTQEDIMAGRKSSRFSSDSGYDGSSSAATEEGGRTVESQSAPAGTTPSSPPLPSGRKKVRFSQEVEVWETHHKDDYPARSWQAPDHPEDFVNKAPKWSQGRTDTYSHALVEMLRQRDLAEAAFAQGSG